MNYIFETNYAVFAIFASLLITEIIGSVVLLLFYDAAKSKVLEYVVPIWEVTGTFAAFWVVNGDMAYPTLLIPVAAIFGALLTIFLITFVGRSAAIVFGEFITKRKWLDAKKLYKAYALSTLLLGVTALVLLSSLVSGAGVLSNGANALSAPFDFVAWASQAGSWLFLVGTVLIAVGLAPVFFDIRPFAKKFLTFTLLGVLVSIGAYYTYSASLVTAYIAVPALLTIAANLLYFSKRTKPLVTNKAVFIAVLSIIIFSLQPLVYPKFVGQALPIDALTTTGPMVPVFYVTSWVGGALLAVMLGVYLWAVTRQKKLSMAEKVGATPASVPSPAMDAPARGVDATHQMESREHAQAPAEGRAVVED
jgi:cytochrome d ubiquinol oxidase subunit II